MSKLSKLFKARVMEGERCRYIHHNYLPHVSHICGAIGGPKCRYCGIGKSPTEENLKVSWEALNEQA